MIAANLITTPSEPPKGKINLIGNLKPEDIPYDIEEEHQKQLDIDHDGNKFHFSLKETTTIKKKFTPFCAGLVTPPNMIFFVRKKSHFSYII